MKEFEYFLFENFDADHESQNPSNPRRIFGKETDAVLSVLAQQPANTCVYMDCCGQFGTDIVRKLVDGGILRRSGTAVVFDCPVFLREDAAVLQNGIATKSAMLANLLERNIKEIRACCGAIHNGFSVERNLYHILCGMVFDGSFFAYLSGKGVLAVSRKHPSGLDYLSVLYEKCEELQTLSDELLCSYNRLVNDKCSLQTFGDANGDRFDFYRFFRLMEREDIPGQYKEAKTLLYETYGGADKDALLSDVISLIQSGWCAPSARKLLEQFGYVQNGGVCVPIYTPEHQKYITEIEGVVERCLGEAMSETLIELAGSIDITAVRHGVNRLEIANELYHIMFGFLNEELVLRKIVAAPQQIPGEGRYFKCIEVY
ncbi:MAG: hypothetical protein K2G51_02785 [Lachnospiraceae bacterium]|nr:hypothetical protein [Lachnospiraceae bacterium]